MTQLETHAASFATMKSSSLNRTSSPEGCTRVTAWCGAGPHAAIVPLFTVRCVAARSARNAISSAVSRSPERARRSTPDWAIVEPCVFFASAEAFPAPISFAAPSVASQGPLEGAKRQAANFQLKTRKFFINRLPSVLHR